MSLPSIHSHSRGWATHLWQTRQTWPCSSLQYTAINEQAVRLARVRGQSDQEDRYTSNADEKTIIKTLTKKKWNQKYQNFNQSDSLHNLNRPEQVILLKLRTGHNRHNTLIHSKFKVGKSEMCPCNADIMTAEHLLQHYQLHDALSRAGGTYR